MIKSYLLRAMMVAASMLTATVVVTPAKAEVVININKGNVQPLPIAVTDFQSSGDLGAQVSSVIAADLQRSGLFAPINKAAFIQKITDPNQMPRLRTGRRSMRRPW